MALNQLALYTANRGLLKQKIESKVKSTKKKNRPWSWMLNHPSGKQETTKDKTKSFKLQQKR